MLGLSSLAIVCLFLASRGGKGTGPTAVEPMLGYEQIPTSPRFKPSDWKPKGISVDSTNSVVVFYNLLIPDDPSRHENAMAVLKDQLNQVGRSLRSLDESIRFPGANGTHTVSLYYNIIGGSLPEQTVAQMCSEIHPGLSCRLLDRYETASESVTLMDLHNFCADGVNDDRRVTYLNSRGSYRQTETNDNWRRSLTDSALHPDCLSPPDDQCDLCGGQFYTRFALMVPGNIWTARCSYVKRLLPPLEGGEFEAKTRDSVAAFLKYRLWGELKSALMNDRADYYGLGRSSSLEHWVGSHHAIRPCELHSTDVTFADMLGGKVTPDDYDWGMGPRRTALLDEMQVAEDRLGHDTEGQFREYFFLPGNLLKWFHSYGTKGVPESDSWVWNHFPAGDRWKQLVDRHGSNAVEEMAKQSANQDSQSPYKNSTELFRFEDERESNSSVPPVVIFYHVTFPLGRKKEAMLAVKTQLDLLSLGSYDIISRSYVHKRPVIVYYTIAGGTKVNVDYVKNLCKSKRRQLDCRLLGEFDSATPSGTTLQNLHRLCSSGPEVGRVSYLTNLLPRRHGADRTEAFAIPKIRAYTTAVTSNMCLKERGDSCNVCGAEFYPLPFNHFRGNMFTATCEYVKLLKEPAEFEERMDKVAGDALVWKLRKTIDTTLFDFDPELLGLGQYNVPHWIGSHPDLKPCDVAPVRYSWFGGLVAPNEYSRYVTYPRDSLFDKLPRTTDRQRSCPPGLLSSSSKSYDFRWALAPRRSSAPPTTPLARQLEDEVRADGARREYWYLAGRIHRWHSIYGTVPREGSWAWTWFPGGKEWLEGWTRSGIEVVGELTTP